jgi:hypothetical protein
VGDKPIDAGQRIDPLELEPVTGDLPAGFETLRAEALAEGFRQVERLAAEWAWRTTRFDREGEALLAARLNGVLVGIGGLTIEPVVPGALRMRRFYVAGGSGGAVSAASWRRLCLSGQSRPAGTS